MKEWWLYAGAAALAIAALAGWRFYTTMRTYGFFRPPVYDTVRPALPAPPQPAVLVFSKTNGFIHHEAIPAAKRMLEKIAAQQGWSIYITDNAAVHNREDLAKFNAIVWNNVSGDVLTEEQRLALQNYLTDGGGFVGLHATGGDMKYAWKWHPETLLKAQFVGHPVKPQFQTATIRVENTNDPIVHHLGSEWVIEDEWYSFAQSPRAQGVDVLASLDETTYSPKFFNKSIRMGDHPIIWKHCVGNGRVFYSALGHRASMYAEQKFIEMTERAIAWAAGLDNSRCVNNNLKENSQKLDGNLVR